MRYFTFLTDMAGEVLWLRVQHDLLSVGKTCWSSEKMWEVKPSVGSAWQKMCSSGKRRREGGRRMASSFVRLFTWWHPGCPRPSAGMPSIFQASLINPETTPPFSFHFPICLLCLHLLLPQSNRVHRRMPWILLLGSGVWGWRSFFAPPPCTLHSVLTV